MSANEPATGQQFAAGVPLTFFRTTARWVTRYAWPDLHVRESKWETRNERVREPCLVFFCAIATNERLQELNVGSCVRWRGLTLTLTHKQNIKTRSSLVSGEVTGQPRAAACLLLLVYLLVRTWKLELNSNESNDTLLWEIVLSYDLMSVVKVCQKFSKRNHILSPQLSSN